MMKKDLPENFPLDMNIATGNWGINTKCGYKPTFFGKIVCKEFPAEFTAEKYVVRIRMALAYNRFNIQRTPDSALILRSLIKGLPPVNSKAGLDVGGTVRGIVDVGAHFTPVPGGTSILHQLQEFTKRFRGVLSSSHEKSVLLSPVSGAPLAEIDFQQTLYKSSMNLPKEFRNLHRITEPMPTDAVVYSDVKVSADAPELSELLNYMEENGIKPGKKYGAPRFLLRFEHEPVLDELAKKHNEERNVRMFVDVSEDGESPRTTEDLMLPIERGLSGKELRERFNRFTDIYKDLGEQIEIIKKEKVELESSLPVHADDKVEAFDPLQAYIRSLGLHLITLRNQYELIGHEIEILTPQVGVSKREDF